MTETIIGIDQSLAGTALCCFQPSDPENYFITTFKTKKDQFPNILRRLIYISNNIMKYVTKFNKKKIKIFIEGFSYGSRGSSLFEIAGIGYILRKEIIDAGFSYYDVPPTTLKMFTCLNGAAKKDMMLLSCYKKYGQDNVKLKDDNQVDAYCLARFGEFYLEWLKDRNIALNKKELQAFEKIGSEIN